MKHYIPTVEFKEDDASRLIADFGKKPSPEKKQELDKLLRGEKEKFMSQEHIRMNSGPDRSH